MQQFTYRVHKTFQRPKKMALKDEWGQALFLLRRKSHTFIEGIFNALLSSGLPYTYIITQLDGKPFYSTECSFPGFGYRILDHQSQKSVPVAGHRVQLIEIAYSFNLDNRSYYFEKDFAGTGRLKCDDTEIAAVSMSNLIVSSELDVVHVEAVNKEVASLAAVLFHTFFYYNA